MRCFKIPITILVSKIQAVLTGRICIWKQYPFTPNTGLKTAANTIKHPFKEKDIKLKGFTLLEVLISITILSFLSLLTARSIKEATRSKTRVQNQIDRSSLVYDAVNIMARDIQLAFNYRDINIQLYNAAQQVRQQRASQSQNNTQESNDLSRGPNDPQPRRSANNQNSQNSGNPQQQFPLKQEKIITHFLGEEERMDFTSLSYTRTKAQDPASDQAEISYYLERCKSRLNKEKTSTCLWRRAFPYIDEDLTQGGEARVLLEDVKLLKFRYRGTGEETEWLTQWRSNDSGDTRTQNKFPHAVEIHLEILDETNPNSKLITLRKVASIKFPNNQPPQNQNNPQGGQNPSGGQNLSEGPGGQGPSGGPGGGTGSPGGQNPQEGQGPIGGQGFQGGQNF